MGPASARAQDLFTGQSGTALVSTAWKEDVEKHKGDTTYLRSLVNGQMESYLAAISAGMAAIPDAKAQDDVLRDLRPTLFKACKDEVGNLADLASCLSGQAVYYAGVLRKNPAKYGVYASALEVAAGEFESAATAANQAGAARPFCGDACSVQAEPFDLRLASATKTPFSAASLVHPSEKKKAAKDTKKEKTSGSKRGSPGGTGPDNGSTGGIGKFTEILHGAECKASEMGDLSSAIGCSTVDLYREMKRNLPLGGGQAAEANALADLVQVNSAKNTLDNYARFSGKTLTCGEKEVSCTNLSALVPPRESEAEDLIPNWQKDPKEVERKIAMAKEIVHLREQLNLAKPALSQLEGESKICNGTSGGAAAQDRAFQSKSRAAKCLSAESRLQMGHAAVEGLKRQLRLAFAANSDLVTDAELSSFYRGDEALLYAKLPTVALLASQPHGADPSAFDATALHAQLAEPLRKFRVRACAHLDKLCKTETDQLLCNETLMQSTIAAADARARASGSLDHLDRAKLIRSVSSCLPGYCRGVKHEEDGWKDVAEAGILGVCGTVGVVSAGIAGGVCGLVAGATKSAVELYQKDQEIERLMTCFLAAGGCAMADLERSRVEFEEAVRGAAVETLLNMADPELAGAVARLGRKILGNPAAILKFKNMLSKAKAEGREGVERLLKNGIGELPPPSSLPPVGAELGATAKTEAKSAGQIAKEVAEDEAAAVARQAEAGSAKGAGRAVAIDEAPPPSSASRSSSPPSSNAPSSRETLIPPSVHHEAIEPIEALRRDLHTVPGFNSKEVENLIEDIQRQTWCK